MARLQLNIPLTGFHQGIAHGLALIQKAIKTRTQDTVFPLIQIKRDYSAGCFKVYPNPVIAGRDITIECKEFEEGYHVFQLISHSGKVVFRQETWLDESAGLINIELPVFSSGAYFLRIGNCQSGKGFAQRVIIRNVQPLNAG
jgi:hypothetical protein